MASLSDRSIGIIGFGSFGRFIAGHLRKYFRVFAYDPFLKASAAKKHGVRSASMAEAASKDIVILAVPSQSLKACLMAIKKHVRPGALILDVCSVKVKPVRLMSAILPRTVEIIGTHPLFGPQSGKDGIEGLTIVVCPVRTRQLDRVTGFLKRKLKLQVLIRTPSAHDKEMAMVQGLTHFIGRALVGMGIGPSEQSTRAYQRLVEIKEMLGSDSWELFYSIEHENPFAAKVRERFIRLIRSIDKRL